MRDFLVFEEHMRMAGWNGAKLRQRWGGPPPPPEPPAIPPIWFEQPIYYKCNRFRRRGLAGPSRFSCEVRISPLRGRAASPRSPP